MLFTNCTYIAREVPGLRLNRKQMPDNQSSDGEEDDGLDTILAQRRARRRQRNELQVTPQVDEEDTNHPSHREGSALPWNGV